VAWPPHDLPLVGELKARTQEAATRGGVGAEARSRGFSSCFWRRHVNLGRADLRRL
jgi:hypothetical protein